MSDEYNLPLTAYLVAPFLWAATVAVVAVLFGAVYVGVMVAGDQLRLWWRGPYRPTRAEVERAEADLARWGLLPLANDDPRIT